MTLLSAACDKSVFDGNTILLEISKENDKYRYLYIGADMICSFLTNDNIHKYISNMGNNLSPYSIAIGEENTYFLSLLKFDAILIFNGQSNNISHIVVAQNFIISTCLRYVYITDFVNFLEDYNGYKVEIFRIK